MDIEEQYDKIYRYCYFKLREQNVAEDITQQTFLLFIESDTYRNTGQELQYLYTIARNLCIDEYRKKVWECLPEEIEEHGEEEKLVTSIAVKAALAELKEEERELVLLRYVNEVPVSIISKLLGISRFVVYRRTREVLKVLRNKLRKEDFYEN